MKKIFCDLCGNEVMNNSDKMTYVCDQPVLSDKKAKIQVRLTTGFVTHSSGFGGPPDLCLNCFRNIVEKIREKAQLGY